ncbi:MAG: GNAT family N-acetyltransferase [Burkholderiales bacterium]
MRTAEVFDEYWLERATLPRYEDLIAALHGREAKPDLFTFAQRVPDVDPAYAFYHEMDNYAVLPLSTYERWFQEQIPTATRRGIRASHKRGVSVRISDYDDRYVSGISSIYNEAPLRAGKQFWHYGKDLDTVRRENGTYLERSTYLAAEIDGQMAGYLKVVWDGDTAAIMQILSKLSSRDARPNNALMDEVVRQACLRGVKYLLYEKFDYGKKRGESLTRFKQNNGFVRMDVPRYYVPLSARGQVALRLGLHRDLKDYLPETVAAPLRDLRARWNQWRIAEGPASPSAPERD